MDRCLTLLGVMAFTVGVFALASAVHASSRSPQPTSSGPDKGDALPPAPRTRPAKPLLLLAGPAYHTRLSLN